MFPTSALVQHCKPISSTICRVFAGIDPVRGHRRLAFARALFSSLKHLHLGYFALVCSVLALIVAFAQWLGSNAFDPRFDAGSTSLQLFTGLLVYDSFAIYVRLFLLLFLTLALWLTLLTGIPDRDDSADFLDTFARQHARHDDDGFGESPAHGFHRRRDGQCSELCSCRFSQRKTPGQRGRSQVCHLRSSASGIMLYGISLLAGKFGTGYLPIWPGYTADMKAAGLDAVLLAGTLFILIGLGFKLAAVPFHFWCPDVFEGAAAEVAGFLSVASKGAALALTARLLLSLTKKPEMRVLLSSSIGLVLAVLAALTATLGNLAALGQTNLKRLLAYSTIAHAGYMMMALVALTPSAVGAILFYLIAYLLMNLGAFAVVAFLRNLTGSEELSSFSGLIQRADTRRHPVDFSVEFAWIAAPGRIRGEIPDFCVDLRNGDVLSPGLSHDELRF